MRLAPLVVLLAATAASAADTVRTESAGLRYAVPSAWTRVPAPSDMRAAQFRIPRAAGDAEDGELVLFYFGKDRGGSVEDNLARWYGQLTQPDGSATGSKATQAVRTVGALKVTVVDVSGTYRGMGGAGPKEGYRMLAAIVEGADGPWFWKAIGPDATVKAAKADFDALLGSLEPHR